jgi:hypothetical protein
MVAYILICTSARMVSASVLDYADPVPLQSIK